MKAHDLKKEPTKEVKNAIANVEANAAATNFCQNALVQSDDSVLFVRSVAGLPADVWAASAPDVPEELGLEGDDRIAYVYANVDHDDPPLPRLDDSPPPQGLGDDGVLRDENGQTVPVPDDGEES